MKLYEFFKPCIIGVLVLALILGTLFLYFRWRIDQITIQPDNKDYIPQSGLWYCEELQIHLSFTNEYESTVVIGGETMRCTWGSEIGCSDIHIIRLDENGVLRESLLWGEYVSLDEKVYTIRDHKTGEVYSFIRIE